MATLSSTGLDALAHRIRQEVESGNITAAQVAIGFDGNVVHFEAFGTATVTDRLIIFSATKTLVAMALLPHFADGTLDLTTPVAHYLPEFGHHGKADVTVLQLLTMQGGFPQAPIGPAAWGSSDGRRSAFAQWTLDWPAGSRTEYHPVSAHWVIAELLETLNQRSYLDVVHERIMQPAGVGRILGPEAVGALTVRAIGEYPSDPAVLAETYGRPELVPVASIGPDALLSMNDPRAQAAGVPGGGAIATAADIAAIYQHFLHNRGGALPDDWLADARGTIRNGSVSVSDMVPANRTIAAYTSGNDGYHLHRWMPAAPQAFGHAGAGGQLCWADPVSGLSFSFLHDTLHQDPRVEFHRAADLNDLALALLR
ncbi:MAG: serine hydrolase domain-containing protein [Actinomycetota bacterium]|nr:serine hydrolase domain-containing protein [Actinomycetota bacterium]